MAMGSSDGIEKRVPVHLAPSATAMPRHSERPPAADAGLALLGSSTRKTHNDHGTSVLHYDIRPLRHIDATSTTRSRRRCR